MLLGARITIARNWKGHTVPLAEMKRKISWIMAQEKMVSKLLDKTHKFKSIWEPWAKYMGIPLIPEM